MESNIIVNQAQHYHEEKWRGVKHDATASLDVAEIAKLVRKDIAAEVKAGTLPEWKYAVRIQRYSGGQSIRAYVVDTKGYPVKNPARAVCAAKVPGWENMGWQKQEDTALALGFSLDQVKPCYSAMVQHALKRLQGILDSYNRDCSDSMVDYFHVRFYGFAEVDWDAKAAITPDQQLAAEQEAWENREYK